MANKSIRKLRKKARKRRLAWVDHGDRTRFEGLLDITHDPQRVLVRPCAHPTLRSFHEADLETDDLTAAVLDALKKHPRSHG